MIDCTCRTYEQTLEQLLWESRRILKKISRVSPRSEKFGVYWAAHAAVMAEFDRISLAYKLYRQFDGEWKEPENHDSACLISTPES